MERGKLTSAKAATRIAEVAMRRKNFSDRVLNIHHWWTPGATSYKRGQTCFFFPSRIAAQRDTQPFHPPALYQRSKTVCLNLAEICNGNPACEAEDAHFQDSPASLRHTAKSNFAERRRRTRVFARRECNDILKLMELKKPTRTQTPRPGKFIVRPNTHTRTQKKCYCT